MVADFVRYYTRISNGCRFHEILHQNRNISWLQTSSDISPESLYLMAADFMIYYTLTSIYHICRFYEILNQNHNISWLQFHEMSHSNLNISFLRISWDFTPESQYLMVADFMRYYTRIPISQGCKFHEIFHQNWYISWLPISWDVTL